MNDATIEVTGLRKRLGRITALDGMSFTVQPGQVTGFVGPNGAGKSTTMRVILSLDAADAGSALIGGRPYRSLPQYPQVDNTYTPVFGYYPLAPWAGFAVLCAWAAVTLALAVILLHRRDA